MTRGRRLGAEGKFLFRRFEYATPKYSILAMDYSDLKVIGKKQI
jgi:hypothetical protein